MIVVMLLIPSAIAMSEISSDNKDVIESQNTGSGKADLIITDIVIKPGHFPYERDLYCQVENIGDTKTEGIIELHIVVKHMLFGLFPIKTIKTYDISHGLVIDPGEIEDLLFADARDIPSFGFFKFFCIVNPDQTIEEEFYFNNIYDERFLIIFSQFINI